MDIVLSDFSSCMPSEDWGPPPIAPQLIDPLFSDSYQSSCNALDLGTLQIVRTKPSSALTQRHAAYIDVNRLTVPHEYMQRSSSVVNDLLFPLLQSVGILDHGDAVCQYLSLAPDLWNALFRPTQPSPAQQLLSRHLSEVYGILPAGLWDNLVTLRSAPYFEHFQHDFVEVVACVPNVRGHSQSSAGVHKHEEPSSRRTLHPPRVNSPGASFQTSGPVADPTAASMATAIPRGRTHLRGPSQRAKGSMSGRAPWGHRYFCPADHCSHQPFRNAGNYLIHMARFHAEHPKHNPADSLRADPSPVDDGDEGISSTTTNIDDSPGYMRTWTAEDLKARDLTQHAEYEVYRPPSAYRDHGHCQGGFEHAGTHPSSSSIGDGVDFAMEEEGSSPGVPFHLAVVEPVSEPEHSMIPDDWLSFGMFQAKLQHHPLAYSPAG